MSRPLLEIAGRRGTPRGAASGCRHGRDRAHAQCSLVNGCPPHRCARGLRLDSPERREVRGGPSLHVTFVRVTRRAPGSEHSSHRRRQPTDARAMAGELPMLERGDERRAGRGARARARVEAQRGSSLGSELPLASANGTGECTGCRNWGQEPESVPDRRTSSSVFVLGTLPRFENSRMTLHFTASMEVFDNTIERSLALAHLRVFARRAPRNSRSGVRAHR